MAGTVKKLQFSEGTDVGAPTDLSLATSTTVISPFANDGAYVTSEGPAADGSVYLNSTINKFRHYISSAWRNAVPESDSADPSKLFLVDLTGVATTITSTLLFVSSANRSYSFPDVSLTVAGRDNAETFTNKTLEDPLIHMGGGTASIDVNAAGSFAIGASVGANNLTLGGVTSTVVVAGNLEVDGTTTTVNSATLDVTDANITVNNGGTDGSSEGAGLEIDRTSTHGSIIYANAANSKFKCGDLGSEIEIARITGAQTIEQKRMRLETTVAANDSTSPRLIAPTNTFTNLNAISGANHPSAGAIYWASDLTTLYYWDGSVLKPIASSTSGESVHTVTSANYAILDGDGFTVILVSTGASNRTITMPDLASNTDRPIWIGKIDSGAGDVIIEDFSNVTIYTLRANGEAVGFISDESGNAWWPRAQRQSSNSKVRRYGGNGHGSTDTTVRRFAGTFAVSVGTAITDNSSGTTGAVFDINEDGIYSISYADYDSGGTNNSIGITLNSTELTTGVDGFSDPTLKLAFMTWDPSSGNAGAQCSWSGRLVSGDQIRPQTSGAPDGTGDNFIMFSIEQIVKC